MGNSSSSASQEAQERANKGVVAALQGDVDGIVALFPGGVDPRSESKASASAAAPADHEGKPAATPACEITAQDVEGNHALGAAACGGHTQIVSYLLSLPNAASALELKNKIGTTPLWLAAGYGHVPCLDLLLAAGADMNTVNNTGDSAMLAAASRGKADAVQSLVAAGADVALRNRSGDTALLVAVNKSFDRVVDVLLPVSTAVLDHANKLGVTALASACAAGNSSLVRRLLQAGADAGRRDNQGATPLAVAAAMGNAEAVAVLLEYGTAGASDGDDDLPAGLNAADNGGATPLWHAAKGGHTDVVTALLAAGADKSIANKSRVSPAQAAKTPALAALIGEFDLNSHLASRDNDAIVGSSGAGESDSGDVSGVATPGVAGEVASAGASGADTGAGVEADDAGAIPADGAASGANSEAGVEASTGAGAGAGAGSGTGTGPGDEGQS